MNLEMYMDLNFNTGIDLIAILDRMMIRRVCIIVSGTIIPLYMLFCIIDIYLIILLVSFLPCVVFNNSGNSEHIQLSEAGFVLNNISDLKYVIDSIQRDYAQLRLLRKKAFSYSQSMLNPQTMVSKYLNVIFRQH